MLNSIISKIIKQINNLFFKKGCCRRKAAFGSVSAKDSLGLKLTPKKFTALFPKDWDVKRVLDEIAKGAREERVVLKNVLNNGEGLLIVIQVDPCMQICFYQNAKIQNHLILPIYKM